MKSSSILAIFVASMAACAAFAQLPEVQPKPAPKGTVAQAVDDAAITSKVKTAISSDPALKDMQFTVETTNAVVTLNGTAGAPDQIARALALASAVEGVKAVTNILAVKPPDGGEPSSVKRVGELMRVPRPRRPAPRG